MRPLRRTDRGGEKMAISQRLKALLDRENIKYVSIVHSVAHTAQEVAASAHVKGASFAKTVMVKAGRENIMAVLPASHRVQFEDLARVTHNADVRLSTEVEFQQLFPECEAGAMPPFGNLYGMRVLCDKTLAEADEIVFNAGSHVEAIRMRFDDFARLVQPDICQLGKHM